MQNGLIENYMRCVPSNQRRPLLPPFSFSGQAQQFYQNTIVFYLSSGYIKKYSTIITSAT
jgi:hypothetical protein